MSKLKELKRVVVKEEIFELTKDLEKAILLNQFIYWSQRVNDFDKFIDEERERASREDKEIEIENQNGWIYKDMEELKEEVMFSSSITTIGRKLNDLIKNGWIERRNNPKYKWDKRYQYRVNLNKISIDLFEIGYILQDYKVNVLELLKSSNVQIECSNIQSGGMAKNSNVQNEYTIIQNESSIVQNDEAISEITTETTSEIKTFNPSQKLSTCGQVENNIKENERMSEETNINPNEFNQILANSKYDDLEEEYILVTKQAIRLLYYSDKPLRTNNFSVPPTKVREDLKNLRWEHLDFALRDFKIQSEVQLIRNVTSYLAMCIYNSMISGNLKMESELRYEGLI